MSGLGEVSSAAATSAVPGLQGAGIPRVIHADTADALGTPANLTAALVSVTPRVFETLGVPIVFGREFTPNDTSASPAVVAINSKLARIISTHPADVIGRRLSVRGEIRRRVIVGVVGDTRDVDFDSFAPLVYLPHTQEPQRTMTLLARMPHAVSAEPVTGAISAIDRDVPPYLVRTYQEGVRERVFGMLTLFAMFGGMAAAAALLAAVGLFGAFSCVVSARMRWLFGCGARWRCGYQPVMRRGAGGVWRICSGEARLAGNRRID